MKQYDVIIIGGGPAGIIAAGTARTYYPDKDILVIRKEDNVLVPCGIPYTLSTIDINENFIPNEAVTGKGSELLIDEVESVDVEEKVVKTSNEEFKYDKLILATGSLPTEPGWLQGRDKENVFFIRKDADYLEEIKQTMGSMKEIIIIGGGFIGVEVADELNKENIKVTIIEKMPHTLNLTMDSDFCVEVDNVLNERGINVITDATVTEITGDNEVSGVKLSDGKEIEADAVIVSVGYTPNSGLAQNAGIKMGERNTIWVDEYMRTDKKDVFAIGDCVERKSFITRKVSPVMLASTATSEARIAGANLYKLQVLRTFTGTIGIFSTRIGTHAFGCAGLTQTRAEDENFDIVSSMFETKDRHPGSLPDASGLKVKLIASKKSGIIIGGQVCGSLSAGEIINLIGLMIQKKMSIHDIVTLQIGTHPLLTSAPTVYPVIKAAESIIPHL